MKHSKYSMVNWFIRQAMEDKAIKNFENGVQIRDCIYVEDLCDAFIKAADTKGFIGQVFNIGSGIGTCFRGMTETVHEIVGARKIESVPLPKTYINVETGDHGD
jgi:UDP-glucose 4-epimerase